jgi:hypothetical protein
MLDGFRLLPHCPVVSWQFRHGTNRKVTTVKSEIDTQKDSEKGKDHPVFHYTVDKEPQETAEHVLTPEQILTNAGVNPKNHYLVELVGNTQKSYEGNPHEPIHMHEKMEFVSVAVGPTPTS